MGAAALISVLSYFWAPHAPYRFVSKVSVLYRVSYKDDIVYYGHLDESGDFVIDPRRRPFIYPKGISIIASLRGERLMRGQGESNLVYEFRSGLLVPGEIKAKKLVADGKFVPDEGGVVVSFFQYDPANDPRSIYNLPGRFEYAPQTFPEYLRQRRSAASSPPPAQPATPVPPQVAGAPEYVFVPDTAKLYYVRQGNYVYYGQLDEDGDFQFSREPSVKLPETTKPPKGDPLMAGPGGKDGPVYQYRSGRLVPGRTENGKFIPDLGGVILPFTSYHYGPDARPIYNLPGRFERVAKK